MTVILAPGDRGRLEDIAPTVVALGLARAGVRVARFDADPSGEGEGALRDAALAAQIRGVAALLGAEVASPGGRILNLNERPDLILAGFSRGARVSAALVQELGAVGLVGLAYPFHGRRDPDPKGRVEALLAAGVPTLICQGTRDSHGNQEQVRGYGLPARVRLHWLADANHALQPRARSGSDHEALLVEAAAVTVAFVRSLLRG